MPRTVNFYWRHISAILARYGMTIEEAWRRIDEQSRVVDFVTRKYGIEGKYGRRIPDELPEHVQFRLDMAQEWTSLWTSLHRYIDHPGRAKHLWYRKSASTFKSGAVFAGAKGYAIGNSLAGYEFYTDVMLACECIFNDPETKECNVRKIMFDGQKEVDVVVFKLELEVDSLAERYRREALRWIASGYDEEFEQNEVVTRGPILPSAIVGEEVVKKSTNIC